MNPDIQTQIELEELHHKNQLLPRLRAEFEIEEIFDHADEHDLDHEFIVDLLAQMVLHKRATASTLIGILWRHFTDNHEDTTGFQHCADAIVKAAEVDFIDWHQLAQQFVLRIDVSDDVYADLERYQYPLPLVVLPKEVKTNRDTGYWSMGCAKGSLILRGGHHDDDICLDHINRVNRTALRVNPETAEMVQNQWRGLDRQKTDETKEEYLRRVKAFEKYDRTARDVMQHLFMAGNRFHLSHKYDKRGRCYAQGYHVNPQGNDWNKAVIEFADGELVTGVEIQNQKAAA